MRAFGVVSVSLQPRVLPVGALLLAAVMLGGGTRQGHLSDAILQAIAIPVLIWSLTQLASIRMGYLAWGAIGIATLLVALPILQLAPWFPAQSGGVAMQRIAEIQELVGDAATTGSHSVAPRATLLAALAGLPALAIFLGTASLSLRGRRQLASAVLLLGGVSVFLGLLQAAEGPNSTWRFFSITNNSEAVGFFANRNHFSALLYVLLLFAACWAIVGTRRLSEAPPKYRTDAALILPLVVSLAAIVIFVAAQAYTRSRAGVGLGMVALAAVIVLSMTRGNGAKGRTTSRLLIGAIIAGLFMSVQFALYRVIERFEADPLSDDRVRFAANTLEAAQAHLPYGTGLGTFVPLYGLFEKPSDAIIDTFANRAHNDILEGWLETGLPGAILFACFLVWFLFAAYTAWMTRRDEGPLDTLLARAACVAIVLLLLHSFVDYPLRTAALQCLFAMSCAFLIPAEGGPPERELPRGRHAAEARTTGFSQASEKKAAARAFPWPARGTAARKRRPDAAPRVGAAVRAERWGGGDVEWPAEWHRAGQDAEASRAASAHEVSSTRKNRGHAGDNAVPPVAAGKITVDHDDMG